MNTIGCFTGIIPKISTLIVSIFIISSPVLSANLTPDKLRVSSYPETINGVVYGGDRFVAVGDNGAIATSTDGIFWGYQESGIGGLTDITYGDGRFVAVGSGTAISSDGINWSGTTESGNGFNGATFGNAQFIAVKDGGVFTSTNGISWTEQSFDPFIYLESVCWGPSGYVAVGGDSVTKGYIYHSLDGISWTQTFLVDYGGYCSLIKDIAYGDSGYIACGWCGNSYSSTNGVTWSQINPPTEDPMFWAITYGDLEYVALTHWGNCIYSSSSGIAWAKTAEIISDYDYLLNDIAYGNELYVAVGIQGRIYSSFDAQNWTRRNPPLPKCVSASCDYDGDGTEDIGIFRNQTAFWKIRNITSAYFGRSGDIPVCADYNGDGTTEMAYYRPSTALWSIRGGSRFYFGQPWDLPVVRDYDGDGSTDPALFRDLSNLWILKGKTRIYFGSNGDIPVPGDYDGDGQAEPAVFRPGEGLWIVRNITRTYFGKEGDIAVPGDYDGDGTWDQAYKQSSSNLWAIQGLTRKYFGKNTDNPIPARWGGVQKSLGFYRKTTNLWKLNQITRVYFGKPGDIPLIGCQQNINDL